jgi:polyprenyldihydroxybenzoate methyltransferase / 3-demethylubiquinol 3-O-methyltransferase
LAAARASVGKGLFYCHQDSRRMKLSPRSHLVRLSKIAAKSSVTSGCRLLSTVNPQEISRFDDLASTWWDPQGSSRLLHRMNPVRLSFVKSVLGPEAIQDNNRWLKGLSILDVGCGGGILCESLARLGATTHGLDPSRPAINVAKAHLLTDPALCANNPPVYVCGSIQEHELQAKYDIITAMEVLEHIDYPSSFIVELARRVKPGGWLIISTISRTWQAWLGAIIGAERILHIVPSGTHTWNKFIKEPELRQYIDTLRDEEGERWTSDVKTKGIIYDPTRGEWHLTESIGGPVFNYFLAARRALR